VTCTDCKQLLIWNVDDEWKLYSRRFVRLLYFIAVTHDTYLTHVVKNVECCE